MAAITMTMAAGAQTTESLTLEGSKGKLHAELQMPAMKPGEKVPVAIICHGFSGNCGGDLLTDISDELQANGVASLRFDFNGHGRSEGAFEEMTVPNEIEDLKKVIEWTQAQPWAGEISLAGHSQGGVVAGMTAGELGERAISRLVLMAPAAVLREDAIKGSTMGANFEFWNLKEDHVVLPWGGQKLGREYIEKAVTLPIFETSLSYTGPVLLIHGIRDRIVPYSYAERYHEGYKDSKLRLMPDEDHSLRVNGSKASHMAAEWLLAQ